MDCDFTFTSPLTLTFKPTFSKTFVASSSDKLLALGTTFFISIVLGFLSSLANAFELILISKGMLLYIFFAIDLKLGQQLQRHSNPMIFVVCE